MALSAEEQELFDLARAAMPDWFSSDERANEFMGAAAKVMGAAHTQTTYWLSRAQILIADGVTSGQPDWLEQHGRDRGTRRVNGETDATMRTRLRTIADAITRVSIMADVQALFTGIAGTPVMLELPRDMAFLQVMETSSVSPVGGTFAGPTATVMTFTPTGTWPFVTWELGDGRVRDIWVTFASAANAANNGTYQVTGRVGNAVTFVNAAGVAGADATVTTAPRRRDLNNVAFDGFGHSYLTRGERMSTMLPRIILILPYGTTAAVTAAVTALVTSKKAAGIALTVETRSIP